MAEDKNTEVKQKVQGMDEMERELKSLEIEAKKAELIDLRERLAEREMKRENKKQRSVTNGQTMRQTKLNDEAAQRRCNHRKGGNGQEGVVAGRGDDSQHAVLKHQFCNGDIWVRCLRCGKTWKPLVQSQFTVDGKLDVAAFEQAQREYQDALAFQTRNTMSGSIQYRFSDGGEHFRKSMASVSLR